MKRQGEITFAIYVPGCCRITYIAKCYVFPKELQYFQNFMHDRPITKQQIFLSRPSYLTTHAKTGKMNKMTLKSGYISWLETSILVSCLSAIFTYTPLVRVNNIHTGHCVLRIHRHIHKDHIKQPTCIKAWIHRRQCSLPIVHCFK